MTEETPEYRADKAADSHDPPDFKIRADLARLALTAAATTDIRDYLCGLRLVPRREGGVYIFGSDGHAMVGVIDSAGYVSKECVIKPPQELMRLAPKPTADGSRLRPMYLTPSRSSNGGKRYLGMSLTDEIGRPVATAWEQYVTRNWRAQSRTMFLLPPANEKGQWFNPLRLFDHMGNLSSPAPHAINQNLLTRTTSAFQQGRVGIALWQDKRLAGALGRVYVQFVELPHIILVLMPLAGSDAYVSTDKMVKLWGGVAGT